MKNLQFRVELIGGFGNRIIEFMAALAVQARIPDTQIFNISIPEFLIEYADLPFVGSIFQLPQKNLIDIESILENRGRSDIFNYSWYAQDIRNLLPAAYYRDILRPREFYEVPDWGGDKLVINLRGEEILDARHRDYVLVPIAFYLALVKETGLKPVFYGQLTDSAYMRDLRLAFPDADFVPSKGAMHDFAVLLKARHFVPCISTFSWLAAFLSEAKVYMPLLGLFNPFQSRDNLFTPLSDERFSYYLFPLLFSQPVSRYGRSHEAVGTRWKQIGRKELDELLKRPLPEAPPLARCLPLLDATFYHWAHRDLMLAFRGDLGAARQHYIEHGHREERQPLFLDDQWYLEQYPEAGVAVGRGDYRSLLDFHIAEGARRGHVSHRFALHQAKNRH